MSTDTAEHRSLRVPGHPRPARDDAATDGRSMTYVPDAGGFGLHRLAAVEAFEEYVEHGALLVDIRPADVRAAYGGLAPWMSPLVAGPHLLERLLDPRSAQRIPRAAYDLRVIVLGQAGYTSALAAHSLQQLGVRRATDIAGGFVEWQASGLPVIGPAPV